ncbi:protein FAR-RED ELONGATED HYPOCOTYL 3-like [Silene latifolia]|uniref:protein FAR-RED ELONGATED HYPOCOTYL 3-like n=1 Tax=Silene latifolia TaxID=37657 RepID=UPI003D783558
MWHILKKLPEKVGPVICKDTEFLKKINRCVWSKDVEPPEFEERWTTVVESHGLSDNEWLKEKRLDENDLRVESKTTFSKNFTNPNLTLVEFWMRFESAMDAQRWTHSKLVAQSKTPSPFMSTPLALEKHASEIYTPTIFGEFQKEVEASCYSCGIGDKEKDKTYPILYTDIIDQVRNKTYKVGFKKNDVSVVCTCKKFERHGMLCRHALCVFKDRGIQKVPSDYLLSRWSKLATFQPIVGPNGQLLADCTSMDVQKNKVGELWSELFTCVALVEQSLRHCDELLGILREFKERVKITPDKSGNTGISKVKDKNAEIGMLLGTNIPSEIKVLPPRQCKNKGSGKRLISQRERAGEVTKKPLRKCRACGEMANHDSRNCDRRTTDNE